ncbi:hypothetical protein [Thermococcus sp. Bubb.Bath]|uniref:hypothetical protein n=1 Tax=Thermococcus sp. Bubb.Bath TaxID=1638242 RepID=UPI00143949D6|nr:hypothetical protein [Thermococcus sp. Bubb.Bath]NJF25406.1 hypothetical protein [Thermococcus sp. Bubb.Bath]
MRVRLGYPDRLLVVDGKTVYLFKKRLYSAPLEEITKWVRGEEALLPPVMREVAIDVVNALELLQKTRVYSSGTPKAAVT